MKRNEDSNTTSAPRTAIISRDDTGPIGVCIYLTSSELLEIGIDPVQAKQIEYRLIQVDDRTLLSITKCSVACTKSSISD